MGGSETIPAEISGCHTKDVLSAEGSLNGKNVRVVVDSLAAAQSGGSDAVAAQERRFRCGLRPTATLRKRSEITSAFQVAKT